MFFPRRRPLLGAAMIGGAGFLAGRRGARMAYQESEQDQRLEQLEDQRQDPAPPPAAQSGPAPDLVDKLNDLAKLKDSGALSADEFAAAKQKLLGS
jgi:hypothetical protein